MPRAIGKSDPSAGRAAVGIEADVSGGGARPFAGDRQERHRQIRRQALRRRAADAIAMPFQIEIEGDRLVADDRFGPRQAQTRGQLGGSPFEPERPAPRPFVSDDQSEREAEDGKDDDQLDQGKAGSPPGPPLPLITIAMGLAVAGIISALLTAMLSLNDLAA